MRIWVTGIGVISPLGRGADVTMNRLIAGDRAFGEVTLFDTTGSRSRIAAEVSNISAADVAPEGRAGSWSRTDALSVFAVREALGQAGVHPGQTPIDLVVGGTTAGMYETEELLAWLSREPDAIKPMSQMLSHPLSSTADHLRIAVGPFRRVRSVCSACSGGANAIMLGAAWIRAGASRCVIAGGADGLCRLTFAGFGALSAVDPGPCRPFDKRRAGLNLGEGAGFVVLEPEDSARARGAKPLAELRGWAVGAEAHHITNPECEGSTAARVMTSALRSAGLSPTDVDYINAHGTATPLNDSMESAAIRACFGAAAKSVAVSSIKGQIGHTLGAAGAIEAAVTVLSVARGVVPPTGGLEEVDPACDLKHVTRAQEMPVRAAMSNSFGFGGTDTALVFTAVDAFPLPKPPERRDVVIVAAATIGPLGVLGTEECDVYFERGAPPEPGPIAFQHADYLDVARARRMDRAGRLSTVVVQRLLRDAAIDPRDPERALELGAVMGGAFGSVDGSTSYMARIHERGVKYASPIDFPNLVPSSPVGHVSIYLGLRGPVFAVADLGATAECAVTTAADLITVGEAHVLAAGSVEEVSALVERCLSPICSELDPCGRSEGASALLLESADHARARGARILARLSFWTSWRDDASEALASMPAPLDVARAAVVTGHVDARLHMLGSSPWVRAARRSVARRASTHEGIGGMAMAAAVAALTRGTFDECLVVGTAPQRGYALLLCRGDIRTEHERP
ncbi:MAG: 3-oxoacyl-ACP synthase [Polyangiaceae bacterium]|nr:3-oxoacyl-ACP synthase [Polyangiaceae bacterium]